MYLHAEEKDFESEDSWPRTKHKKPIPTQELRAWG